MTMPIPLTPAQKRSGWIFFLIHLLVLPNLLSLAGLFLHLNIAELNVIYYAVNFFCTVVIFRKFLLGNLVVALDRLYPVLWWSILGYLGSDTLGELVAMLTFTISPEFVNANDAAIAAMLRSEPLFAIAVTLIAPISEELLYRGLLFRGFWDRSQAGAYIVSMALFAAAHVVGYIGLLSPLHLILSFVQYLPAGYCLAFAYRRSGTILCPMLIHIAVNIMAILPIMR